MCIRGPLFFCFVSAVAVADPSRTGSRTRTHCHKWPSAADGHTVVVIAVVVLYMMYGPPAEQQCVVSMYLARAFVVVALVMANGALN